MERMKGGCGCFTDVPWVFIGPGMVAPCVVITS